MLKITIVATSLPRLMDQTTQLKELGFVRDGHIELTFLADTIGPQRLYIQKLRTTQCKRKPTEPISS